MPDGGGGGGRGGGWGPPPPPPGNLGALQGLFGTRPGNMPIQSGYYAPQFSQNPVMMPVYPNAPYNILAEEGMCPDIAPPPQPGCFQQMGRILQIRREKAPSTKLGRSEQLWALVPSAWQVKHCNEWVEQLETGRCAHSIGKMVTSFGPLMLWAIAYYIHLASADSQPHSLSQNPS